MLRKQGLVAHYIGHLTICATILTVEMLVFMRLLEFLHDDSFDDLIDNSLAGGNAVIRVGLGQGATHRNHGSAIRTSPKGVPTQALKKIPAKSGNPRTVL